MILQNGLHFLLFFHYYGLGGRTPRRDVLRHHVRDAGCSLVPELVMQARLLVQGTTSHVSPPLGDSVSL